MAASFMPMQTHPIQHHAALLAAKAEAECSAQNTQSQHGILSGHTVRMANHLDLEGNVCQPHAH